MVFLAVGSKSYATKYTYTHCTITWNNNTGLSAVKSIIITIILDFIICYV